MGTSKGYIPPKSKEWRNSKTAVSRMINGNDNVEGVKKAVSEYAKAYSSTHLPLSKAGALISDMLGFFSEVKVNGLNNTLKREGLDNLIGKSNEEIYFGLIEYFCTDNSTIEDSVLRECVVDVLSDNEIVDLENLEKLDGNKFIEDFIIKYIQVNFEVAFAEKVQGLCDSVDESKSKIREVNIYIDDTIRNLYKREEIVNINWRGEEGKLFIDKKCRECYELLMLFEEE
ncbi:hypothetical protein [Clostridium perfringens]|uniref:hypothetical protein n=1 Tax=Clostridium perfringens TaxID=1502 RepID=UPI0013E2AE53|nr:hypothetical protein [Clostridium perfringens]NGT94384.1 hypothetical protein [Clostridium perfringens]